MLDQNTENLINLYFKYSGKNGLTVDEFLSFRKQVVSEANSGIRCDSLGSKFPQKSSTQISTYNDLNSPKLDVLKTDGPDVKKKHENARKRAETHAEDNPEVISNDSFLAMMKNVED